MARGHWAANRPNFGKIAAEKAEHIKGLVAKLRERQAATPPDRGIMPIATPVPIQNITHESDSNFASINQIANADLVRFVELLDTVIGSSQILHTALFWPHLPPRAILPWMLREVSRGRHSPPVRTLFLNMSRSALQSASGVEAKTDALRERGVYRSCQDDIGHTLGEISPDAHFFMFLGNAHANHISSIPLSSIMPHAVAINDGIYWRDFDEKALKGFKRYFQAARLHSMRKYLDVITSAANGPAFAFLLPSHFERSPRKSALLRIPGCVDLVVIDMGTQAVAGNVSELASEMISQLEECSRLRPRQVLVTTDCPLRFRSSLLRLGIDATPAG